jgi:hypothetical protein
MTKKIIILIIIEYGESQGCIVLYIYIYIYIYMFSSIPIQECRRKIRIQEEVYSSSFSILSSFVCIKIVILLY